MEKYKDANSPIEIRVDDLLSRMTLEEKMGQLLQIDVRRWDHIEWIKEKGAGSILNLLGEDANAMQKLALGTRLGIPLLFAVDAIHGNAFWTGAAVYPSQLAISCSWNPGLAEKIAHYTAREVNATGGHWTFSPVFCLARDLRWGRIDETFGEDPYLIGEMGSAMVKGYQGDDVSAPDRILACAKHYAGYSETQGGRDATESDISRRKLLSYFLPPFEAAAKAGCKTFMAGYQCIDGVPCSANPWLMTDLLRKQWGFDGFVVSDWDNLGHMVKDQKIYDNYAEPAMDSLAAGNDMIMTTPESYQATIDAVKSGRFDEKHIDLACRRILKSKFEIGLFDGKKVNADMEKAAAIVNCREHINLALDAAYQSLVLLKNEKNTLPLGDNIKKIAIIGPNADDRKSQLGDWSDHPTRLDGVNLPHPPENIATVLTGLKKRLGDTVEISYCKGCQTQSMENDNIPEAMGLAAEADVAVLVLGDNNALNGERRDRATLDLTGKQMELFEAVHRTGTPVVVVMITGKPLGIPVIAAKAAAIIQAFNPGMAGGDAVAGIMAGDHNPQGKLTISFARHVGQQPVYYNQLPGWHYDTYADLTAEPLYSFGYGLSYTTYSYSNLEVMQQSLNQGDNLEVSVKVRNTGDRAGVEIIQLYINDLYTSVSTPVKELKAFKRISLEPGEEKEITFSLEYERLSLINANLEKVVEPGAFEVMVGGSSRDEDLLKKGFEVK